MNIVICGKSGSGKTKTRELLTEYLRYEKIITCTNRPKRQAEVDGVDYNFKDYDFSKDDGFILKNNLCGHTYGLEKSKLDNVSNGVIIVDPSGLKELQETCPFEFVSFMLMCDKEKRMQRCLSRGDSIQDFEKRSNDENTLFYETIPDYYILNYSDNPWNCVESLLMCLKEC